MPKLTQSQVRAVGHFLVWLRTQKRKEKRKADSLAKTHSNKRGNTMPRDRSIPEGGIKVGMGATYGIGSDRYPFTVVEVLSETRVVVQADRYKRIDKNGLSELQEYEYTPDPEACRTIVTRRKQGDDYVWRKQGDGKGGGYFGFHGRHAYIDPSF